MLIKPGISQFMLIKIRYKRHIHLTIPIAFFTFDELISAIKDLVLILQRLFPQLSDKIMREVLKEADKHIDNDNLSLKAIFDLIEELFEEIRRYRGLKLVEADVEDLKLMVKFY